MLMKQIGQDLRPVCAFWTEELDVFLGKIFLYQQHKGLDCLALQIKRPSPSAFEYRCFPDLSETTRIYIT